MKLSGFTCDKSLNERRKALINKSKGRASLFFHGYFSGLQVDWNQYFKYYFTIYILLIGLGQCILLCASLTFTITSVLTWSGWDQQKPIEDLPNQEKNQY